MTSARTSLNLAAQAFFCVLIFTRMPAYGATTQDLSAAVRARPVIEQFLLGQTAGLPGKVSVTIDEMRLEALPTCEKYEAFLPPGVRPLGRISVGLRCNESQPWTRYIAAQVVSILNYYVAVRPIEVGQALTPADIAIRDGDIASLPGSLVIDPAQLSGMVAISKIAAGAPLRKESLRGQILVQHGQDIKLVTRGTGFIVSTEGKALTDAAAGSIVQVKIQGGQILTGIVNPDGSVMRNN